MWCFRYALIATMFCSCVFLAACGSGGRSKAMNGDPVAQSGARSEELWYQYGGARLAYTAVARPRQLYTGYGGVLDPALSGKAPDTSREKTPPKKRSRPKSLVGAAGKSAAAPQRSPDCPPCPPPDALGNASQSLTPQRSPASSTPYSTPAQAGALPAPTAPVPDAKSAAASPRMTPLPAMPPATPAPVSAKTPGS